MFDFLIPILVVGVITLGIYKLFELIVCRRERRMIIDKMDGSNLIDYLKFMPMGIRMGAPVSVMARPAGVTTGAFKTGCLLLGLGLGLLVAFMMLELPYREFSYQVQSVVYSGSILLFGGLGLIVSFVVERALSRKE